ncbi:hypothetical protein N9B82_05125 [Saprospiraceae bacterium]|nr:hypothetical protein [Saprospiraceae bacterium]
MLNFFKKRSQKLPPFETLRDSSLRDKYFARTMQWGWFTEETIHVFDVGGPVPRMVTMDPWPQQIYLDADGQITIKEYVLWMAGKYSKNQVPKELDETILGLIEDLVEDGGLIELRDHKSVLVEDVREPRKFPQ